MKLQEGIPVDVTGAHWLSGYVLEIVFSDGLSRTVDFEPFLSESVQPDIRKYMNVEMFKTFSIRFGNLVWNDYDMCFPIEDLYSGTISAFGQARSMVAEKETEYRADRRDGN
ncbi:MAG: DUF2442 domain-containing protein [Kiritimatiellales bacterium]|nr:DUF2442 domain-containing protein [Kiritimatiellales bacterium]